jgi:hypothetical protein
MILDLQLQQIDDGYHTSTNTPTSQLISNLDVKLIATDGNIWCM